MKYLSKFIFRTPLYPFLKSTTDKLFSEAIYITSPSLRREYEKYKEGKIESQKEIKKLNIAYYKYLSRASSRCTPFGLFAGLGTGEFGNDNKIVLNANPNDKIIRRTRPDMNVICMLAKEIENKDFVQPYVKFFPNNSIYKIDSFYRYVEYYYAAGRRVHKISKVDFSDYLEQILESATEGKTALELVNTLIGLGIEEEEATPFIKELINFQLLVSDFEPSVTGKEFYEVLIDKLHEIQSNHPSEGLTETIRLLLEIKEDLNTIDENVINEEKTYEVLHSKIKLFLKDIPETNLFQTDLYFKTEEAQLNSSIQDSISDVIAFLNKITPNYNNTTLENFKKNFSERYEEAEMPLLQVLDVENGIGYPNKNTVGVNYLIDDLEIGNAQQDFEIKWTVQQKRLFELLLKSHKEDLKVLTITEEDFKDIDYTNTNLPHSFAIKFNVLNAETEKIQLDAIAGATANLLIGRFGHGNEEIAKIITDITAHEESHANDSILAEIAHLPESRIGNILSRPDMRTYEMAYLAKSNKEEQFQIQISDLYVSIRNGNIILRSKKLNKQIIPRLGNAHNFSFNSLPVYHFLCDLQLQFYSKPSLYFNWGSLASQFRFLPRVEYKNVVLKAATWQLNKTDFEPLLKGNSDAKTIKAFNEFKSKFNLPDLFLLVDGDNELLINTDEEIAIFSFIDTIKNRGSIHLEEFLFDTDQALIKDNDGNCFTNECVAFLLNEETKFPKINFNDEKQTEVSRYFLPGSEWLYFKVYCGVKTSDYLLTEIILPIIEDLSEKGKIKKWFYLRYFDSDYHLRFRLHLENTNDYDSIMKLINEALSELHNNGLVAKVQLDTYNKEIERYGVENMETSEKLFHLDSVFCTNFINYLDPEIGTTIKWQIALRATDQYLDDFGLDLEQKAAFTEKVAENFFIENNGNTFLRKQLNEKYRKMRSEVEDLMLYEKDAEREILPLLELLNERSYANKSLIESLGIKYEDREFHNLVFSYIHMMHNRIFNAKQRHNEFVIYELLSRHFKSFIARKKYAKVKV
ncbi:MULTISPECIES: lantibiotic dehydratase [Flavobacterium]|uniref:Lantibiotic dehydratase n=1 Tax=Flavobacterium jumunjinense TaxID=998845 RepID=A0ABV5GM18_9FLAO|nr:MULTISPECIES: lantibiotic dehydratase [Flavobacterium]